MNQDSLVTEIKGVGGQVAKKLAILGVKNVGQLIDYYPRRYDDFSEVQTINKIRPGAVTLKAKITNATSRYVRRGMHITEAIASDKTGSIRLIWFNQPYRSKSIQAGEYYISGDFGMRYQKLSIQNPSVELVGSFPVNTARILPIYRETKGIKSSQIRKVVSQTLGVINVLNETLPEWLVEEERLLSRAEAIMQIHFPSSQSDLIEAKRRLGFEEVFQLTLAALLNKAENASGKSSKIEFDEKLAKAFVKHLPFTLTDDQKRVIWQIYKDLEKSKPMNRLIQGDVGSGKTVVAAMVAIMVMAKDYQVAFMAPTEILARQHANTLYELLKPLGLQDSVGLLVGGLKPAQKLLAQKNIATGSIKFIVGTNALIQEKVDMHNLGLVIIDEQHRFGVEHRKKLQTKAGQMPHVLSMTATPIPRSLALTLYGELDMSLISTKPVNRAKILTKIVPLVAREKVFIEIDKEIEKGHQAFFVCPYISESDVSPGKSVEQVYEELSKGPLKHRRIGLLHGKMKPDQKESIMNKFVKNELDILVSTTVIEVGVDVPNATVMVIEDPDRFGLAQIHQLRGRVGRSSHESYCYLLMSGNLAPSARLRALEQSNDGFKLAEYDLEMRGPGAIYGTLQHGQLDLRIAKLSDVKLITSARKRAQEYIDKHEDLLKYPELHERVKSIRLITNLN